MARVRGPESLGFKTGLPASNTASAVGRAQPAKVVQPKLIGDFTDKATSDLIIRTTDRAVSTATDIMGALRKKEDERATLGMKNGFMAVENDLLFKPNSGLKAQKGQNALDMLSGESATGRDKGISLVDQYRSRLQSELNAKSSTMSNLARESAQLDLETAVQKFDKQVGQYAIQEQANADKQTLSTAQQRQVNRIGDDPSAATVQDVRKNIRSLILNPELGLAKQAGLNPNSDDPLTKALVQEMLTNGDSMVLNEQVNQLLKRGEVTKAKTLFKNSKALLNGKHEGELNDTFLKLEDATVALATFQKLVASSTDRKTQVVDRRKMLDSINKINEPKLQKAMSAYYNTMVSQENAISAQSQKTADTQYTLLKVQKVPDAEIIAKYPQLVAQMSDDMRVKIANGQKASAQLKAANAAGKLSKEEEHVKNDGIAIGGDDSVRYNWALWLSANDPDKFQEEFGEPKKQVAGLTLKHSEEIRKLAIKGQIQKRLSDTKIAETDTIKLAAQVLDQMGYSDKVKTQAGYYTNTDVQNFIGEYVATYVKDHQHMPSRQELNKELAPLMLEVIRPATGFAAALRPDKTSVFFELSQDPSKVDAEVVDISGAKDRRRIGIATGNGEKEVEQAIDDLDENGIDEPTYRQLRGRLDANDLGLAKTPDVDKAVDMALADGVPLKFMVDMFKMSEKEVTAANMTAALEYLHDVYPDPEQFQLVVQSTE